MAGSTTGTGAAAPVPVAAVRERRQALVSAMGETEAALAAPLLGRGGAWAGGVEAALGRLGEVLEAHTRATERPGGLLATVRLEVPRLDPLVRRLEREHVDLRRRRDAAAGSLTAAGSDEEPLGAVRDQVTELLAELARHRQRGADLLYEAYALDIGGDG